LGRKCCNAVFSQGKQAVVFIGKYEYIDIAVIKQIKKFCGLALKSCGKEFIKLVQLKQ